MHDGPPSVPVHQALLIARVDRLIGVNQVAVFLVGGGGSDTKVTVTMHFRSISGRFKSPFAVLMPELSYVLIDVVRAFSEALFAEFLALVGLLKSNVPQIVMEVMCRDDLVPGSPEPVMEVPM